MMKLSLLKKNENLKKKAKRIMKNTKICVIGYRIKGIILPSSCLVCFFGVYVFSLIQ